ncbi:hypothetical protein RclHR1_04480014 [Rhizophagus clarus]|uniref:Uncharacterized protein n=1 Tax=Rhizophagus clarus TaxID=94130 RepID=A0A2Z6RZ34_9GLOM|nr:hypothetical protein RclHR1_04480014 [Rhizophagus clarus]
MKIKTTQTVDWIQNRNRMNAPILQRIRLSANDTAVDKMVLDDQRYNIGNDVNPSVYVRNGLNTIRNWDILFLCCITCCATTFFKHVAHLWENMVLEIA